MINSLQLGVRLGEPAAHRVLSSKRPSSIALRPRDHRLDHVRFRNRAAIWQNEIEVACIERPLHLGGAIRTEALRLVAIGRRLALFGRYNNTRRRTLRAALVAYGVAMLVAGIALLLRWHFGPVVHNHLPLISMYAAVAFAAWYGGYGPGLLVTALGYLAAHYVLSDSPGSHAGRGELEALPDLIVYAAGCLLLTGLGAGLRSALDRAADREKRLEQEATGAPARRAAVSSIHGPHHGGSVDHG